MLIVAFHHEPPTSEVIAACWARSAISQTAAPA